jgi:cell wall-associated NlpC family hydrolase
MRHIIRTYRGAIRAAFILLVAGLSTGCSATRSVSQGPYDVLEPGRNRSAAPSEAAPARHAAPAEETSLTESLEGEVESWLGVPHAWGGTTRRGVDCSGFVYRIYSDLLGVELPRTTDEQKDEGRSVGRSSLRAGDLVFFRPTRKTRHVGIMLDGSRFAHASSSRGVMISEIDEPYWRQRYWLARRILAENRAAATVPSDPSSGSGSAPPSW